MNEIDVCPGPALSRTSLLIKASVLGTGESDTGIRDDGSILFKSGSAFVQHDTKADHSEGVNGNLKGIADNGKRLKHASGF
jgi:hypothetical protein